MFMYCQERLEFTVKIVLSKCNYRSETLGSPVFLHCVIILITLYQTAYFIQRLIIRGLLEKYPTVFFYANT